MKRLILAFILIFFCLTAVPFSGCGQSVQPYSVDQFCDEMKDRGYSFELQDATRDFLPTDRKRLDLDNEFIDIYVYKTNGDMESDALNIDAGGCSYKGPDHGIFVSWVSQPHFFKKGNIIVQYIGENDGLVSDLRAIMGEEFAGYSKIQELNQ